MKVKTCRTLEGLQKAIRKGEPCCLKYTDKCQNLTDDTWIIYQASGTNLIVTDETHRAIEPYLKQV